MSPYTPEQRQLAIDIMAEAFVQNGMPDDEATELATEAVDKSIEREQS